MAANPWTFLENWAKEHVNATVYDDKPTAEILADECLRDAQSAGFQSAAIIKAAGGNLVDFMLAELNSAANKEVDRQVAKRD